MPRYQNFQLNLNSSNTNYTVPSIPPQYPAASQGSSTSTPRQASVCVHFLLTIIGFVFLIVIFFITHGVLYSKHYIKFNVTGAKLNKFDMIYNDNMLNYSLVLDFTIRNSYKFGMQYDLINITANYVPNSMEILRLASKVFPTPYHAGPKSTLVYKNVVYEGYGRYPFNMLVSSHYSSGQKGPVCFYVNLKLKVRYRPGILKIVLKDSWSLWQCLEVALSNKTSGNSHDDFELTKCKNLSFKK